MITGGGIGDGDIDGLVNVYVIDNLTYQAIDGATVEIGTRDQTTDASGLVVFQDLHGAQTVTVKAAGYRAAVWEGANGANITVPVTALGTLTPQQATLSGSITGWDTVTVPTNHIKAALIGYSQNDRLADSDNNIATPMNGNLCGIGLTTCAWSVVSRTGQVTLTAAIIDRDTKGTTTGDDDVTTIIGWAISDELQVNAGANQTGLTLAMVEAGNLQDVTVDLGTPPAALPTQEALIGIELANGEAVQMPLFLQTDTTKMLVPLPAAYAANATYRLTAVAQPSATTTATDPESVVIERGLAGPTLTATQWLLPPANVVATRTDASFTAVDGAEAHSIQWSDSTGILVEITMFDKKVTSATVPDLVALPATGTLTVRAQGIGATLDIHNFSLDLDRDLLWGISAQPVTVN